MILVDTSAWVDHLRRSDHSLATHLESGQRGTHRFVIGELACGTLTARSEILGLLRTPPALPSASDDGVLFFIERHGLMGRGIG